RKSSCWIRQAIPGIQNKEQEKRYYEWQRQV
ncbi:unnamed protein product, partial [marine sediment metagenome]